jgi:hypothetical protein
LQRFKEGELELGKLEHFQNYYKYLKNINMAAIVTDQFRILNASNFIDSAVNSSNSYYVFLGLDNPAQVGFGRTTNWNTNIPNPTDNLEYLSHYRDISLFGKKITSSNIRRIIRKITWSSNTSYEMYRHDYSIQNPTPNSNSSRLYDSNYYVINSDFRVYICIDNGSSATNLKGSKSQDEPTFTDLEPSAAGVSGDGYIWKYLFSVSPSDIVKFDSTDYVVVPNNWQSSTDSQIASVREAGDSTINFNQIKKVYIDNGGSNYSSGTVDILGDGSGGRVSVSVDTNGKITSTTVVAGGSGYTWAIVDLGSLQPKNSIANPARLIPIIPPSKGHGYDIYSELGTDKILVYARFDDSTKDFPTDTYFSQIGIIKNPTTFTSNTIFTENQYSSLYAIKLTTISATPVIGEKITQVVTNVGIVTTAVAKGYVASYDSETKVLKYFRDRSLYFKDGIDETDYNTVTSSADVYEFQSSANTIAPFTGSIDRSFSDNKVTLGNKVIDLGATFTNGLANPEINKKTGDIIYIDNRPLVERDIRQKEDIKIILEF